MVFPIRLINFNTNDHVDVALVVALRDELAHGLDGLDINIGVDATLSVHNHVAKQVSTDDSSTDVTVEVNNVGAVEAVGAKARLDVGKLVAVSENLVLVVGVTLQPGVGSVTVALLKINGVDLPDLPDLVREVVVDSGLQSGSRTTGPSHVGKQHHHEDDGSVDHGNLAHAEWHSDGHNAGRESSVVNNMRIGLVAGLDEHALASLKVLADWLGHPGGHAEVRGDV